VLVVVDSIKLVFKMCSEDNNEFLFEVVSPDPGSLGLFNMFSDYFKDGLRNNIRIFLESHF